MKECKHNSGEEFPKAVRIKVTKEIIVQMFCKSKQPTICIKGLPKGFKVIGVIQDLNGVFEFILATDKAEEGQTTTEFMPIYERIDCLDKVRVKKAIIKVLGTKIIFYTELIKELDLLTLEKYHEVKENG